VRALRAVDDAHAAQAVRGLELAQLLARFVVEAHRRGL
jgi:hypothetical protein